MRAPAYAVATLTSRARASSGPACSLGLRRYLSLDACRAHPGPCAVIDRVSYALTLLRQMSRVTADDLVARVRAHQRNGRGECPIRCDGAAHPEPTAQSPASFRCTARLSWAGRVAAVTRRSQGPRRSVKFLSRRFRALRRRSSHHAPMHQAPCFAHCARRRRMPSYPASPLRVLRRAPPTSSQRRRAFRRVYRVTIRMQTRPVSSRHSRQFASWRPTRAQGVTRAVRTAFPSSPPTLSRHPRSAGCSTRSNLVCPRPHVHRRDLSWQLAKLHR